MVKASNSCKLFSSSAFYKIAMNFCFWLFNLGFLTSIFFLLDSNGIKHGFLEVSAIWNIKQILLFSISFIFMFALVSLKKHKNNSSSTDESFFMNLILNQFSGVLTNFASITFMLAIAKGIALPYILLSLAIYYIAYCLDTGKEDIRTEKQT